MSVPEVGQSTARRLYRAATAGGTDSFTLAEDVALRLAHACDTLVAELEAARLGGHRIAEADGATGFPDLPTGHALAAGFRGKAGQYLETLTALQEAALCFKAAYLAAAGKLTEADLANRAALAMVAARSGSGDDRHEQDDHG
ncbi:hypothetical protein [Nocardia sp. NBC_01329]|uniref:hypothetical protein n=1 Tax=Nocardia sp. NBC_01329 TaxID=2903594 RepID=UPI002E0E9226|nr:hypothetical protein OG405_28070 [Nocardia sp. NBC_01329]